jgi:hypothetical protein
VGAVERRSLAATQELLDARTQHFDLPGGPLSLEPSRSLSTTTEITVLGGHRYRVEGDASVVERAILDAARGSIMEFAWLVEVDSGERIGVNPECVVMLRTITS